MKYTTDIKLSDKDLANIKIFQRLVDSIFERVPDKYRVESVSRVTGEDKVIVRIKPDKNFADISSIMMEVTVE